MRLLKLSLFFIFIVSLKTFSQNYNLDNVKKEELELKKHKTDTSASAAIMFKKFKNKFIYKNKQGYQSITEVDIKIKIFKKEGLKWANFSIPYYTGYKDLSDELVSIEKATTYNLLGNKIEKTKVTSKNIIDEEVNNSWGCKKILFPNVKEGSIIELKYTLKTENLSELPEFQFQYDIPVDYAEYESDIPEFYIYKIIKNGLLNVEFTEKIVNGVTNFFNEFQQTISFTHRNVINNIKVRDVPAILDENYVINVGNYFGKIELELQTIRMPDQEVKHVSKNWNDVAQDLMSRKMFGEELKQYNYLIQDARSIVASNASEAEKIEKIVSFLQNRMTWNGKYSYYASKSLESIYKEKVGSSGEINLILVAMLRLAGLDANPVLVSTRDLGRLANFPNKNKLNSIVVRVKMNGQNVLCDASSKFSTINLLSLNHVNGIGQVITKEGKAEEIIIRPDFDSKKNVNLSYYFDKDYNIKGKIKILNFGYDALEFRSKFSKINQNDYLQKKEDEFKGTMISNYQVENLTDLSKPVTELFDFESDNLLESIGDKIYLNPLIYFSMDTNPFKSEKRSFPIEFSYSGSNKVSVIIEIPKGFKVENLPTALNLVTPDKSLSYYYNIQYVENQIQVVSQLNINANEIPSEYYNEIKAFFNEVVKKQTEKIVLKKI